MCQLQTIDSLQSEGYKAEKSFPHAQYRVSPRQSFTSGPVLLTACLHPLWSRRRAEEIQESSTSIIQRSSVCEEIQCSVASCAGRLLYGNLLWRQGAREGCFSKELFEACQKCTWMHSEIRIYRSNCSVPGRDETMNKFFSYDLQVFESNSFCSNLTCESNLTVETPLPFPVRTDRHGRPGSWCPPLHSSHLSVYTTFRCRT